HKVYINSAVRTPIGSFNGALANFKSTELGSIAIKGAMKRAGVAPDDIEEVYMGNVVSAGLGQAPARQATLGAGCPNRTEATTINKVCASGMKAIMLASQSISLGHRSIMVAGGMESMSKTPYYVPRHLKFGHDQLLDGLLHDGLWDPYHQIPMGRCAEQCGIDFDITRDAMDEYALRSYERANVPNQFNEEIIPISLPGSSSKVFEKDEEVSKLRKDKVSSLPTPFMKAGRITAVNSSKLSDGAAALVMSNQPGIAEILGYADAATEPMQFPIAPSLAIPKALANANVRLEVIDLFEFNEAFAVVVLANQKILKLESSKVNVAGGAIALGHPIGYFSSELNFLNE
ncbi:erg10, acetyl-CoA C-acetyltransferase, partial [Coelomomyces lativittatus]